MDGDVEEDVDFVRFMIGWQKSEAADFFALQKIVPDKTAKTHHSFAMGLFGTIDTNA